MIMCVEKVLTGVFRNGTLEAADKRRRPFQVASWDTPPCCGRVLFFTQTA